MTEGFHFYTEHNLVELLGLKAKNPVELLDGIKKVPAASIYYHTHRFIQQHEYLTPEPPNDFAFWLKDLLHLERLGEAFLDVDTVRFCDLEALRGEFVGILDSYISTGDYLVDCPRGQEFFFMSCQTFEIPTTHIAHDLKEFAESLSKISIHSLYFHMFEARLRLKAPENDFSAWFKSIGAEDLAKEVAKLDPYHTTLQALRLRIIDLVENHVKSQ
jgi:Family of unknown function (DUF5752)